MAHSDDTKKIAPRVFELSEKLIIVVCTFNNSVAVHVRQTTKDGKWTRTGAMMFTEEFEKVVEFLFQNMPSAHALTQPIEKIDSSRTLTQRGGRLTTSIDKGQVNFTIQTMSNGEKSVDMDIAEYGVFEGKVTTIREAIRSITEELKDNQ